MTNGEIEYKKIQKFLRGNDERRYWATPVLNDHQWEVRELLTQLFQKDGWFLLAGIGLSTFVNPEDHPRSGEIKQTSVLFAVITKPPFSKAVLLIVESGNPGIESLLELEGIRWISYSPLLSAAEFAERVIAVLQQQSLLPIGERRPINTAELEVTRTLLADSLFEFQRYENHFAQKGENLWEDSPAILHEVALHRMRPEFRPRLKNKKLEQYMLRASVDILVHGRGNLNRPLLALEIDGKPHETDEGKRKDQWKNEILYDFGVPLIRISPREADFWNYYSNPKERRKKMLFSRLLTSIAQAVSIQVMISVSNQIEVNDARLQLHFREDKLAKNMFGREYLDLADEQQKVVDFSLLSLSATTWDDDYQMTVARVNFDRSRSLEELNERKIWPKELAIFAPEPVIFRDPELGIWAEIKFKIKGISKTFATPRIRLMVTERFDDELMRETIAVCLIENISEAVREQLGDIEDSKKN